jgi:hypothetical protein
MSLLCGLAALVIVILLLVAKKPWDIGAPTKIKHYVAIGEWWAGALNAGLLLVLAATARWWFVRLAAPANSWLPAPSSPRWFWPLVAVAMGLTAVFGMQRISQSLWDDEAASLRRVILGEYRLDDKGKPILKKADWEDAFWNYRLPTNHHLQTLISKASLSVWQSVTRPKGLPFTEPVLRWPLLLAAIASIATLALLLRRLGFARAGVLAAFLLALHPWHVRYAIELRGYIFTLLFGPLMVYCLINALSNGRWRWWLGFAASQFLLLYAYPGTLYMLVAANTCGLVALWFRHPSPERLRQLPRLLVASTLSGMVWVQLMAPNLPQLAEYLKTDRALGALTPRWHMNMAAHFLSGIPWNNSDNKTLGFPELLWITGDRPWFTQALLWSAGLLIAAGALRLAVRRPAGWFVAVTLLVPAFAVYVMARLNNNYLYEWYLIFALPGLCACAALAVDWPLSLIRRPAWQRLAAPALLGSALAAFVVFTQPARHWLLTRPLQPIKDVVLTIRPSLDFNDPRQAEIMTVSLGVHLTSYDPNVLSARDVATLTRLARQADAADKPLFLVTGNEHAVAVDYPELQKFIRDPRYFEPVAKLQGYDPTLTQSIWLYRSGSLAE